MEEAQEILLNSLEGSGISLPTGVSSIQDLTPGALVSICSQSLRLIDGSSSFSASLPDSMAEKFKICTDIASSVKALGYRGDLSFHQFLYPSDEDSYKLVRFLVERLSQTSEGRKVVGEKEVRVRFDGREEVSDRVTSALKDWIESGDERSSYQSAQSVPSSQETQSGKKAAPLITSQVKPRSRIVPSVCELNEASSTAAEEVFEHGLLEVRSTLGHMDEADVAEVLTSETVVSSEKEGEGSDEDVRESNESGNLRRDVFLDGESIEEKNDVYIRKLEQKLASLLQHSSKIRLEVEDMRRQEKLLMKKLSENTLEAQALEDNHMLLKSAVEMAFDDQHPHGFYIEELNERVDAKRRNLAELEKKWDAFRVPLEEEKKISLEQSLQQKSSGEREKLLQQEKVELEIKATASEILKRDEEHSNLKAELEKQPKIASRKSYIQRITEITKSSRKQDADIERILQETRQLQIESNSIQDRLHRTNAVVDEAVFRDAKNDPMGRRAYRLLTSIHESFGQIAENIRATDRARREAAEQEAKLAAMASRSFDIDKLQADLEAIRKENELLEQQIQHN